MFFRNTQVAHKSTRKPLNKGIVVLQTIIFSQETISEKNIKTLANPVFARVFFMLWILKIL